jgi:hypothetical protein
VSVEHAPNAYGVVIDNGDLDVAATEALRRERGIDPGARTAAGDPISVVSDDGDKWLCPGCGAEVGTNAPGGYLDATDSTDYGIHEISPLNRDPALFVDPAVIFRMHACRSCGQRVEGYLTVPEVEDLAPQTTLGGGASA